MGTGRHDCRSSGSYLHSPVCRPENSCRLALTTSPLHSARGPFRCDSCSGGFESRPTGRPKSSRRGRCSRGVLTATTDPATPRLSRQLSRLLNKRPAKRLSGPLSRRHSRTWGSPVRGSPAATLKATTNPVTTDRVTTGPAPARRTRTLAQPRAARPLTRPARLMIRSSISRLMSTRTRPTVLRATQGRLTRPVRWASWTRSPRQFSILVTPKSTGATPSRTRMMPTRPLFPSATLATGSKPMGPTLCSTI